MARSAGSNYFSISSGVCLAEPASLNGAGDYTYRNTEISRGLTDFEKRFYLVIRKKERPGMLDRGI